MSNNRVVSSTIKKNKKTRAFGVANFLIEKFWIVDFNSLNFLAQKIWI